MAPFSFGAGPQSAVVRGDVLPARPTDRGPTAGLATHRRFQPNVAALSLCHFRQFDRGLVNADEAATRVCKPPPKLHRIQEVAHFEQRVVPWFSIGWLAARVRKVKVAPNLLKPLPGHEFCPGLSRQVGRPLRPYRRGGCPRRNYGWRQEQSDKCSHFPERHPLPGARRRSLVDKAVG